MACSTAVPPSGVVTGHGLLSLPREVLQKILVLVSEAAVDEHGSPLEDEGWLEVVPLRRTCRSFRDMVDAGLTARTLRVEPNSPRDPGILLRVTNWLRDSPRAWPHLTSLRLHLDWPADYLQFALLTLAGHCTFLTRLHLNTAVRKNSDDGAPGDLDIGVLHSLVNLSSLSLHGFSRYRADDWSASLETLTSVKELELVESGLHLFQSWPELVSLTIDGVKGVKPYHRKFQLLLQHGLRHLSISRLPLNDLWVPRTVETLELREVVIRRSDYEDVLPDLTSLKVQDVDFTHLKALMPSVLKLRTLEVTDVAFELAEVPPLMHLKRLTSLVWSGNHDDHESLQLPVGISDLTALQELVMSDSNCQELPPLDALTCLQKHSISKMNKMIDWPQLTALEKLTELRLSHNNVKAGLPDDLSALVTVEKLVIEACDSLNISNLKTLSRLKTLTLSDGEEVTTLPDLKPLASLQTLHLRNLKRLSVAPHLPGSLTSLFISHCSILQHLPILMTGTPLCKLTLQHLPEPIVSQVTALASLQQLSILDFPSLLSLPGLRSLEMLKSIKVSGCPFLRALDFSQLPLLRRVEVANCVRLDRVEGGLSEHVTCSVTGCGEVELS